MLKELYTAAMGMLPQQTRLEVIANNMANVNASGFKRAAVFERNLIDAKDNFFNVQGDAEQNDPPVGMYIDFAPGSFQKTDNPLDLAIDSNDGFFMVQDEDQNKTLTRSGNFKLSTDGYLQTAEGKKLLGINLQPINIHSMINDGDYQDLRILSQSPDGANLRINPNGEVLVNEKSMGTIQIVDVKNPDSLQQISTNDFIIRSNTEIEYRNPDSASIKQGWLEGSNVDIVSEMVQMIELQRLFELGSKVIQTNDTTLDQSIKIARF